MTDELKLFIPITKVDAPKRLVYGVATAEKPDVAKEICDYESTKPLYQKWSDNFAKTTEGKSYGNLRVMHSNVAAGKLTDISFNDQLKQIEICAKVVDEAEWAKVQEGVYTGFSQGGKYLKRWRDPEQPDFTRYTADPVEISLVDNPCLPAATFSVIKADGSTELRKFKGSEQREPTPTDNEVGEQVWISPRLPGKTFKKKADLRQALLDLDAAEAAKKTAAPVLEALADINDKLAKAKGGDTGGGAPATTVDPQPVGDGMAKKDYSDDERERGAKEGWAKKDGSYPIKTPQDVANAVKDWYRSKGSASDKRHIIKRAKALKATDKLPSDWPGSTKKDDSKKIAGDGDLAKSVSPWSAADLLILLGALSDAEDRAEMPSFGFGSDADVPDELCRRFGGAISEVADIVAELVDILVGALKDEEASEVVANAALVSGLQKLAKIGAKHSKADKERIAKAHDLLVELDPDCCDAAGDGGEDGDEDGDDDTDKMVKALVAERDADRKAFAATLDGIMKVVTDVASRIRNIEAQPLPMGTTSVRIVEKHQDFGAWADQLGAVRVGDDLERLADAARRNALTRAR